jgi:UDP-N-acetylglucosamine--N-acetylmuramyl-(pentapeptide) pyrophosphoryl-undecaprenol N-acetylglucosamine transferase
MTLSSAPTIAIACGGTGGHLFPGIAVAEQLVKRGCAVTLLVSPKDVDQQAVKMAQGMKVVTLPAVGLQNRNYFSFGCSFVKSSLAARRAFVSNRPAGALAMGGFTSAPPIFAAKKLGARTFLHESNTIPGRANRWLSRFVSECFVGFSQAASQLRNPSVTVTGTPVRPQFQVRDRATCRTALGLEAALPTILVMGGSQGASGINDLLAKTLPLLTKDARQLQFFHLSGPGDAEKVRQAYSAAGVRAVVHSFFAQMELALGAATVAVSRSGASSLAELAAVRLPSVLIPFPAATDNHQFFNARAFEETGAACLLEQSVATPEVLCRLILELVKDNVARERTQAALAKWHTPQAAEQIAETMLKAIAREKECANSSSHRSHSNCGCGEKHRVELGAKTTA